MAPFLIRRFIDRCYGLFAAAPARRVGVSLTYYYVGLGILAVLMLIAGIKAYRMWEELQDIVEPDSPADLLESFEEAYAAGELDDQEFEKVRQRLAGPGAGASPTLPVASPKDDGPDQAEPLAN